MFNKIKTIVLTALITFLCTAVLFSFLLIKKSDKSDAVKALINKYYAGEIDKEKLNDYKAKGVVEALGDPHSMYLTKDEFDAFYTELSGNYKGIGVEIYLNEYYQMEIASVFPDTPAYNAGLQAGDIIKAAGDIEITPESYSDAIRFMRGISEEGKAAESFNITVIREGTELKTELNRSDITVPTVSAKEIDGGLYYIGISAFTENTESDFKAAVENADISNYKGMIIDLRDNPGGGLNSVVNIADYLLPEGTIVYISDKNGKKQYYNSDSTEIDIPTAVLINESSASAAEILAAALHDNGKAKLVGAKTYGKGSVQNIIGFNDGTALKLTTAHYYTPSGICIDGIGIEPDYEVNLPDELKTKPFSSLTPEEDIQLQKAIEVLTK